MLFSRGKSGSGDPADESAFSAPESQAEREGQVDNVVFLEGLVELKGAWYLYYGMADSRIGVAIYRP